MNPHCLSAERWRSPVLIFNRTAKDLRFRRTIVAVVALSLRQAVACDVKSDQSKEADYLVGNRNRRVGACMRSLISCKLTFKMATSIFPSAEGSFSSCPTNRFPIFNYGEEARLNFAQHGASVMATKEEAHYTSRQKKSPVRSCSQSDTSISEAEKVSRKKVGKANKGKVRWNKGRRISKGLDVPTYFVGSDAVKDLSCDASVLSREQLRRQKISQANKGRVPWNKGQQHSEETKQLIRTRTLEAMKDPKIREKLRVFGKKKSAVTRLKISNTLSNRWNAMKKTKETQESFVEDWKEMIAEVARTGDDGDDNYRSKSYAAVIKDLRNAWKLSLKERQRAPSRVGFSAVHKEKISEAIKAKWSDSEYRLRVEEGMLDSLLKRGVNVRRRVRPSCKMIKGTTSQKNKTCKRRSDYDIDVESILTATPEKRSDSSQAKSVKALPRYRNSSTQDWLEKLKQIRASRLYKEKSQIEATERARILIAEAKTAAMALEATAVKDEKVLATLVETRRLLAEAAHSVETVGLRVVSTSS